MAQFVESNKREFAAGGALGQFTRVKLSSGQLALAGATDLEIGTVESATFNAGDVVSVRLHSACGTAKMVAAAAITAGATVYGAASGQVSSTANGNPIGVALNAASGAGSIVEVLRMTAGAQQVTSVVAKTADYAALATDSGKTFTNTGATGDVDITLPAAVVGLAFNFVLGAAQTFEILPSTGDKIGTPSTATVPATGVMGTASQGVSAAADGATLSLFCAKTGEWAVMSSAGTWTTGVTS